MLVFDVVLRVVFAILLSCLVPACSEEDRESAPDSAVEAPRTESTVAGTPVRQGYTQPPPPDAEWLPPLPPPFLTDSELENLSDAGTGSAELRPVDTDPVILRLIAEYEETGSEDVVRRLGVEAREHARSGRLPYLSAKKLHRNYLFPNEVATADDRYKGRAVVVTGRVAPPNMLDSADGFKLYRQEPQKQDPVLIETAHEMNFVRCELARPDDQLLRDWQTVHFIGVVRGKHHSDVLLHRCVALTALRPPP